MGWQLRLASPDDAAAAALVASASFLETFAGILSGADIVAHCLEYNSPEAFSLWIGRNDSDVLLAVHRDGGAPVGYALLVVPEMPTITTTPDDIELRRIYILQRAQGTGLGHQLMAAAIEEALRRRKKRLILGVLGRNERARKFYERKGFVRIGERKYRVGKTTHDDVIYSLDLELTA